MGNPIVHWELTVSDLEKAKEFYTTVFDWKVEDAPSFPGYPLIDPGKEPRGAMWVKPDTMPPYALTTYFGVDDVEQSLARAVTAGGAMLVPPTPIEGVGEWGMFVRSGRHSNRRIPRQIEASRGTRHVVSLPAFALCPYGPLAGTMPVRKTLSGTSSII